MMRGAGGSVYVMDNKEILEEIHKFNKKFTSLSSGIRTEVINTKEVAMGNYKNLAREVDEICGM